MRYWKYLLLPPKEPPPYNLEMRRIAPYTNEYDEI